MSAEVTIEFMSPVMVAEEAAAWMATPRPGRSDCGMKVAMMPRAWAEYWEGERGVGLGVVVVVWLVVLLVVLLEVVETCRASRFGLASVEEVRRARGRRKVDFIVDEGVRTINYITKK